MENLTVFLDKYSTIIGNTKVNGMIFAIVALIALIFYILKVLFNYRSKRFLIKDKELKTKYLNYLYTDCGACWLITTVVAIILIILTGDKEDNYIVNFFLSPGIGLIVSLCADIYLSENISRFQDPLVETHDSESSSDSAVSIVINNIEDNDNDEKPVSAKIDKKEVTEEEFKQKGILYFVNTLKSNQVYLEDELNKNSEEMKSQSDTLNILKQERIEEKGMELEDLIYKAVVKGFVTPAEDKIIRKKFHIYHNVLGGNHEVKELYEERYLDLGVHEDRRRQNIPVEVDRRKPSGT